MLTGLTRGTRDAASAAIFRIGQDVGALDVAEGRRVPAAVDLRAGTTFAVLVARADVAAPTAIVGVGHHVGALLVT